MDKKKTLTELSETDKFRAMLAKVHQPPSNGNVPYLTAVILLVLIGTAGTVGVISLRPEYDPVVIITVSSGVTAAVITSLLGFMKSNEAVKQARETHLSVNSRLDAFIENASAAARALGRQEGEDKANLRTDELKAARVAETKPAEGK